MTKTSSDSLQKAKDYCFLLLKFRPRTEYEIFQRLKLKKFGAPTIKAVLAFLKEHRFIDDTDFARSWIADRLKKPLGLGRIRQELKTKGLDKNIIDTALEEIVSDYSEEKVVRKIVQDRFTKLKNIEPQKAKRRVFAYLLRRGFSPEIVMDAIEQL